MVFVTANEENDCTWGEFASLLFARRDSIGDFLDAKAETLFSSADSSPHRGRAALVSVPLLCRGSAPCSRRLAVACCRPARRGAP